MGAAGCGGRQAVLKQSTIDHCAGIIDNSSAKVKKEKGGKEKDKMGGRERGEKRD